VRILDVAQGSDEWLRARIGLATASCFADIIAQSRTKGQEATSRRNLRIRLACERFTSAVEPTFKSAAMRQGTEREPEALLGYEVRTGYLLNRVGFCRHDTLQAGASPDGLVGDDGCVEAKCPEPAAHFASLESSREPSQYTAQIQGVMWVCGRSWCDFISFCPSFGRHSLIVRRIARDQPYIDALAAQVAVFLDEVDDTVKRLQEMP
jgi:hypothetical protein